MFYFRKKLKNSTAISIKRLWIVSILVIAMLFTISFLAMKNNYNVAENKEYIEFIEIAENEEFSREQNITARSSDTIDRSNPETKTVEENVKEQQNIIDETVKEEEPVQNYISISDVKISKDMDLTVRTGLSKEDFKTLIAGVKQDTSKFFYNNADKIYDVCQEYEINEVFFCGLIAAESGWNIADNHRRTNNFISLMYNGKLIKFSSVDEGLTIAAQKLHKNYLTPGGSCYNGKTLSAVKKRFCPNSSTWVNLVYNGMKKIVK